MARAIELVYNVTGQVVEMYPPEWSEGVPSSASCSVFEGEDSADDTAEFSPSVTVDSVSTTVDVASGYSQTNRRKMSIAATTSIVIGRQYLAENEKGQRELVTPNLIVSGDYIELEDDLKYDYAVTSSTLKGLRMSFTVDATWVADDTNILHPGRPPYRAVFAYTVNSIARRHYVYLRLVRQIFKTNVTIEDLKEYWPDLGYEESITVRGQQFAYAIEAATDRVRVDIISAGYKPDQFRDTEIVDELVRAKARHIIASMGLVPRGRDVEAFVQETMADYDRLFTRTVSGSLKAGIDVGTEGAISTKPLQTMWWGR